MNNNTQSISTNKNPFFCWIERIGNKIPNPFILFVYLIAILMFSTAILSWFDVSVKNSANNELVNVKNLLSSEGIQWFLPNIIKNFSGFAPLGAILALIIGAGLAEKVGLLQTVMYKMASGINKRYASYMVLFIAFFSHISSDAALVVMPPLGALIFITVGRHPVAGLLAAIAGVAAGFTANMLIVTTDVLLSGLSTEAAMIVDPNMHVSVIDNWFFMATSVIILTISGAILTDKFVEPKLPIYEGGFQDRLDSITPQQNRGLRMSGLSALIFIAVIALMVIPENAPLRDPQTGTIFPSPFIKGIVPIIIMFFFVVSITYGISTKKIKKPNDVPDLLIDPMKSMAGFIVMVFPLSQFVAIFNWSNMGKFIAISLTHLLENLSLTGVPAFVGLMFLSSVLCMFIASGSAIWSILAPIFVPMFIMLGFHPAFAQITFRIADSSVLPLAPISPFVPLFLGFLQRYYKNAQLGTYYILIFPYSIVFILVWTLQLIVWYYAGLPIGPGVYPLLN